MGIYSPERGVFQYPVAGPDHSPQRAELSALAVSLRLFNGEIHIYSDCATVVRGFNILKSSGFCLDLLNKWDNYDLWSEICQSLLVRNGPVLVFKVAAHGRDASQSQYLTDGNAKADRAAKTLAAEHFGNNFCDLTPSLRWVFDLQVHIVQIFVARSNHAVLRDLGFVDVSQVGGQNVNTSIDTRLLCTCVRCQENSGRLFGKVSRRTADMRLSYTSFPSDCMSQSISGKGLKPDIPHFTHGLNHVQHCVPRPIWILLKFPGKERSLMWLSLTL